MPAARAGHLGRQRGAKVAQIDIARRLTEAIWHMLTTNHPFARDLAPPIHDADLQSAEGATIHLGASHLLVPVVA